MCDVFCSSHTSLSRVAINVWFVVTPVIAELPNVTGGKYVPPSRRGGGATTTELEPVSLKRPTRKKVAPNVNSQEDFPTLGAAPPPVDQ